MEALRLENGRFDVLWGRNEMLLGALATGAEGAVGSTRNVMAPLFVELMRWWSAAPRTSQTSPSLLSRRSTRRRFGMRGRFSRPAVPCAGVLQPPS